MTTVTEIAPDLFRIATYDPQADIQICQFLVRDQQPLLFETGYKGMFEIVRAAVARLIDPTTIRFIGFSHFEGDECGALNEWLQLAPHAETICSLVGAATSVEDFARRPPRPLLHDEVFRTGRYRFRFRQTPHVPHCWDAGLLFEETQRTLLASDLFYHPGDAEPLTESDIVERARAALVQYTAGPMAVPVPYTHDTERILHGLAALGPRTIATHHGAAFRGDGARALCDLALVIQEVGRLTGDLRPTAPPAAAVAGAPDVLPAQAATAAEG
jgi:flavorubredoxin